MNLSAGIAGFFAGIIGAMGMGGGGILLIFLTVFESVEQKKAQGINLLFFLPIALTAILIYSGKGKIRWKAVLPMAALGLAGSAAGVLLANSIGDTGLSKAFAIFLIILGIQQLFAKTERPHRDKTDNTA